jgi:hypothetical protein
MVLAPDAAAGKVDKEQGFDQSGTPPNCGQEWRQKKGQQERTEQNRIAPRQKPGGKRAVRIT